MSLQAYQQYRQTRVQTAGPGQLVLMLYDAALKELDTARDAIAGEKPREAHYALMKVQDMVEELSLGLDRERGGELAGNLSDLYEFMYGMLVQANLEKDAEAVAQVRALLADLREGWRQALSGAAAAPGSPEGGLGHGLRA